MAEWLRTGLQIRLRRFDSGSGLHLLTNRRRSRRRSDGVMPRLGLDRDPSQLGEGIDAGLAAEAAVARRLHPAERHLRLVVHGRAVDVADARLDPPGDLE